MHRDQWAEKLLSLFTDHGRARSVVGDLIEEDSGQGLLRFSWRVLSTALWLIAGQIRQDYVFFVVLGLRAFLFGLLLLAVTLVPLTLLFFIGGIFLPFLAGAAAWAGTVASLWIMFRVGRWIAVRAKGREVTAWLTYEAVTVVVGWAAALLIVRFYSGFANSAGNSYSTETWFWIRSASGSVATLAGALAARRRSRLALQ